MSSLVAQIGQPGAVAYVASKVLNILLFNHACSTVFSNVPIYWKSNLKKAEGKQLNKILKRNVSGFSSYKV